MDCTDPMGTREVWVFFQRGRCTNGVSCRCAHVTGAHTAKSTLLRERLEWRGAFSMKLPGMNVEDATG